MGILARFFRPKEVRDVLFALDSLDTSVLAEAMCYNDIKGKARDTVLTAPDTVRRMILVDDQKPLEVVLTLLINICARDLRSGTEHIYRGTLSMRGAGKRTLFHQCQTMLLAKGYMTKEDFDHGAARIADEIKEAG